MLEELLYVGNKVIYKKIIKIITERYCWLEHTIAGSPVSKGYQQKEYQNAKKKKKKSNQNKTNKQTTTTKIKLDKSARVKEGTGE